MVCFEVLRANALAMNIDLESPFSKHAKTLKINPTFLAIQPRPKRKAPLADLPSKNSAS
jgi:hypothetical protein